MTATVGSSPVRWAAGVRREDAGTLELAAGQAGAQHPHQRQDYTQLDTREKDFMPSPLEVERAQAAR